MSAVFMYVGWILMLVGGWFFYIGLSMSLNTRLEIPKGYDVHSSRLVNNHYSDDPNSVVMVLTFRPTLPKEAKKIEVKNE